jgi:hypothetical protein
MPSTDLHGDDHELGDDSEFSREGSVYVRVAKTETYGTVGADDFEEDCEQGKSRIGTLKPGPFRDGNNE